jgi:DNA-binding CsgD family transcriptional regulator
MYRSELAKAIKMCASMGCRWLAQPRSVWLDRRRVAPLPISPTEGNPVLLLASLFAGRTLAQTAATLSITRPTAKTHLEPLLSG